jgi:uncharacterized protein
MVFGEWYRLPLVVALAAQLSAQLFKVLLYSVTERRFALDRFFHAAGMPSAHSAFVTALAAAVGLRNGLFSDIFAVAFVFAAIVIYDSFRLRGHVQRHAQVLNQLLKPRLDIRPEPRGRGKEKDDASVSEHIGHNVPEVVAGIIWGLIFALGLQ